MAFSLPSFNTAANYAASYRPIFDGKTLADGYKGIKSDEGVYAMQNAVNADFLAKAGMAKDALNQYGLLTRQELVNDAAMERLEFAAKTNKEINALNRSDTKKALLAKLLLGGNSSQNAKMRTADDALGELAGINTRSDQEIAKDNALMTSLMPSLKGAVADALREMLQTGTAGGRTDTADVIQTPKMPAAATLKVPELSANPFLQYLKTSKAGKQK